MSVKVLAITQARTGSSRLPGKVLKAVTGKTLLQVHLERIDRSSLIDKVVVATTVGPADVAIADLAANLGFASFRGSETDVLDRYYQAARQYAPDYVVRITSDCPLIDPALVDDVIQAAFDTNADYASNTLDRTYPDGTDAEVFKFGVLERAWREASEQRQREHVTPYIIEHSDQRDGSEFDAVSVKGNGDFSQFRLTIDYPEDFELFSLLVAELGTDRTWRDYVDYLVQHPEAYAINSRFGFAGTGTQQAGQWAK